MTIGLLIITHNDIGSALLETATKMLGFCPILTETLAVTNDCDPDLLFQQAHEMTEDLDQGKGVLVLTDIYGSTPANIASRLQQRRRVAVVSGINLPMLVRTLNYAQMDLDDLTMKALSGGREGVQLCPPTP